MNDCARQNLPASKAADGPPRMTMRVSRDGGRTYGPQMEVRTGEVPVPMYTQQYPPCQCPQHRGA